MSVVVTFTPHPLHVISPGTLKLISTPSEKRALIKASGIDYMLEIPFDIGFASTSAVAFVREILVGSIGVETLIIGHDYAFGRGREGDVALLRQLGRLFSFSVKQLQAISNGTRINSSTAVRKLVLQGDVKEANSVLGRPYCVTGLLRAARQVCGRLGFPTANLCTDQELQPGLGLYSVTVLVGSGSYDGLCHVKPRYDRGEDNFAIEVCILDRARLPVGGKVSVQFIDRLSSDLGFPKHSGVPTRAGAGEMAR